MARANMINLPRSGKRLQRERTAVGYVRRSTDRQEQSIPDQKRAIEKYAREHEITLLRFYEDDAISGTSTVGRKGFQALIHDARRPRCDFGLVIVYDVKRFGRIDNDEAGYYRHILKGHGVEVIYASENFTGDRTDDLLRPVKQWQAREESKDLSKVTIRGLLSRATAGVSNNEIDAGSGWWMGGTPPFGYDLAYESQRGEFLFYLRYMRDGTKCVYDKKWKLTRTLQRRESITVSRKDKCKLVPSETERVKVVQRIFKLYVEQGRGFKAIADLLNRDGVPTPRSREWSKHYGGRWTLSSVRGILLNPAYGGDMVWNRRTDARFHRIVQGIAVERRGVSPNRLEWNDERDWLVVSGAHEPLVPRRLWLQAKRLLRSKPESRAQLGINPRTGLDAGVPESAAVAMGGPKARFLLSGLIVCPRCGSRYEGRVNYGKRCPEERGPRKKTYVYACGGHIRKGKSVCTLGAVPQLALEHAVVNAVLKLNEPLTDKSAEARITAALLAQLDKEVSLGKATRAATTKRLRKLEATVRNLLDNITARNRDLVDRRIDELERERESLEQRLASLDQLAMSAAEVKANAAEIAEFARRLATTLKEGPPDERKAALRRWVRQIVVDPTARSATLILRELPAFGAPYEDERTREVTVALKR